jgi:AraC-like DNA-binding protein
VRSESRKHKDGSPRDSNAIAKCGDAERAGPQDCRSCRCGRRHAHPIPGLRLYRRSETTACASAAYEPSLVVFVQGQKRINVGKTTYLCDGSNFLLTSSICPWSARWSRQLSEGANPRPGAQTRNAGSAGDSFAAGVSSARGIRRRPRHGRRRHFGRTLDACSRLVDLLDAPQDIPFLSSLIQREIIFRLLRSPQGKHLRAIATLGEQSHRTRRLWNGSRTNYAKPLRVEELAVHGADGRIDAAPSIPLSDRDEPASIPEALRLHVARERMLNGGLDAASAAFEVGYESASQFNREYSRFFGQPPGPIFPAILTSFCASSYSAIFFDIKACFRMQISQDMSHKQNIINCLCAFSKCTKKHKDSTCTATRSNRINNLRAAEVQMPLKFVLVVQFSQKSEYLYANTLQLFHCPQRPRPFQPHH